MYKVNDNIHTYQCTTISAIINQTITWRNTMKEIALCYFASIKPVCISPYRTKMLVLLIQEKQIKEKHTQYHKTSTVRLFTEMK